jgi:hypothetical protein
MTPERQMTPGGSVEIMGDGSTVWVNRITCIGRFCPLSFEVYTPIQSFDRVYLAVSGNETHLPDWRRFQALMLQHYGVTVSDHHMPLFIQRENA